MHLIGEYLMSVVKHSAVLILLLIQILKSHLKVEITNLGKQLYHGQLKPKSEQLIFK